MWYMPYLRVRHAVLVYAYIAAGITLFVVALHFIPGAVHVNGADVRFGVDVSMLLAGSAALVGGFATVLGLNLAAENDGHLEVAWTKPVSREGYALGVFAVDIGAMVACVVITVICAALIVDVYNGAQIVTVDGGNVLKSLAYCAFPLCVYAWIAALTASIKRNRAAFAALFWPAMIVLAALPHIPLPAFQAAGPILHAIDSFNPLDLFTVNSGQVTNVWTLAWGWLVGALLLAAAVVQWRRLQI